MLFYPKILKKRFFFWKGLFLFLSPAHEISRSNFTFSTKLTIPLVLFTIVHLSPQLRWSFWHSSGPIVDYFISLAYIKTSKSSAVRKAEQSPWNALPSIVGGRPCSVCRKIHPQACTNTYLWLRNHSEVISWKKPKSNLWAFNPSRQQFKLSFSPQQFLLPDYYCVYKLLWVNPETLWGNK